MVKKSYQLQPHQQRVVERLDNQDRLIVYHKPGSGKTLTAMAAAERFAAPLTTVGPASLRTNFDRERLKHKIKTEIHNYTYNKPPTSDVKGVLAFDESHKMGRHGTIRSGLVDKIHGDKTLLLTGTPVRNEPAELVPLMRGAGINISKDPKQFNEQFIGERIQNPGIWDRVVHGVRPGVIQYAKNKDVLRKMLHGKVDYYAPGTQDYPRVKEYDVKAEMTPEQFSSYNMVMRQHPDLMYKIRKGLAPSKSESSQMNAFLTASRQVSNIPGGYNLKATLHDAPKMRAAVHSISKRMAANPNYRGVTYSQFIHHGIDPMSKMLTRKGIPHAIYTGSMSQKDRDAAVAAYNSGKVKQLLISGAGGEGLNLKGTRLVQVLEPSWNQPVLEQVKARAIRYQSHAHLPEAEREVEIQNFIATPRRHGIIFKSRDMGTDEYLQQMSKRKQKLNNEFLQVLQQVGSEKVSSLKGTGMNDIKTNAFLDELTKISSSKADYIKPILAGTVMGAGAGALTAPRGQEKSWTVSGGVIGGLASGPAQVGLRRIINRKTTLKQLAHEELPHQSMGQIFKWTGIGAGLSSGITAATGGYKNPEKGSRIGQAADLGIDVGEIALRSIRL